MAYRFKVSVLGSTAMTALILAGGAHAETVIQVTQTSYDALGRPECVAVRMNSAVFGSLPASACFLGTEGTQGPDRISKSIYDPVGQVTQVRQGVGTSAERAYSTFAYSVNGKVTDSIDANGNRTKLAYDGFDRQVGLYYPSTTRTSAFDASTQATALSTAGAHSTTDYETYAYDANANRTEWRRRSGQLIKSEYDNLNRETRQHNPNGLVQELHTGYDLTGKVLYKRFGSASGSGVNYAYDGLGRVASTTDTNNRTVSYLYNEASARTRLTYPDGNWQSYTRDTLNRLTWTGMGAANLTVNYNSLGQATGLTRGNGTSTAVTYDGVGRVQTYGHDLAGTSYDASWTFAYNQASQIRSLNANATIYDYREGQSNTNARTYDGLNRDAGIAGIGGYDNQGNLTNDGTRVMTYDLYNRLKTLTGNGANLTLTYDTEGRLSSYSNNGVVTQFLYDGVNLIAEYNGSGQVIKRYVHGAGTDQPFVQFNGSDPNNASSVRYLYTNYQGSVIATADSSGYKSEIYKYGAYGEPKNGFNQTSFTGESRFRYTGQTILPDAQLYYYKARVYDPAMGRFMQTDPIGAEDDLNLYAYTGGDPVNGTDPNGTVAHHCKSTEGQAQMQCSSSWAFPVGTYVTIDFYSKTGEFQYSVSAVVALFKEYGLSYSLDLLNERMASRAAESQDSRNSSNWNGDTGLGGSGRGNGRSNGHCCFVAGTLVATNNGLKAIDTLKVGDLVLSRDEKSEVTSFKPVIGLVSNHIRETFVVEMQSIQPNGAIRNHKYETTDDHPWMSASGGWMLTQDLRPGHEIRKAYGQNAIVVSVIRTGKSKSTFNLEVADFHSYFVGEERVWVHNCDRKTPKPGMSGKDGAKDVPSWARGERPFKTESGKDFAKRLMDAKYGPEGYPKGPGSEYNKIQKWGDRAFE